MDLSHLVVQLGIAAICGLLGNFLIPRQVPGKFFGLVLVGLIGVWLGAWIYHWLKTQYGVAAPFLSWNVVNVPIIPSILGSAVVIYTLTTVLRWGRYNP
ncbi:MAG: hypothetical protein DCF22_18750 [Leptolyngbya sp.]|nr:MAG: hypothetical protein DCF22_18750 [Leptolyngbya sp.]